MKLSLLYTLGTILQTIASEAATITDSPTVPSDEPQWKTTQLFTSAILNSTNFYRSEHNASDVAWNKTLADFASDYLNNKGCKFQHSGGPYGENLAMGYPNVTASVDGWGNEREKYDFGNQGFHEGTGHFTQLVWKNTTDVGCGRKLCDDSGWYLVCEYWPRGNIIGQLDTDVGKEKGGGALKRPDIWAAIAGVAMCMILGT